MCWPTLDRRSVDRSSIASLGSKVHSLKELRPGSSGVSEARVLFVFDPDRRAVLLVGGDKAGDWRGWYAKNIPVAERRYDEWLRGERDE